ncbi:class I SAM-dependent rRNA methyltransferase [Salipaludibacillus sp. LMS25]|jgi:23S rRNA (cytosine1962-C5)-methyltransferase|uniref:class I SAM-dependent rRNA methyltransferase n=1 Tax=Salipaludibacillus sp. LMS25 TaxID=2924031 RepID=UPI0020D0CBF0|nr:class I SAM-dependent rRNA methyltransferase [Salipaludibacillus sp. LMS25]UTR16365.1 class I SAM-dependent rRNA methyltransferase [Salipaludibacillus sp. LMS25]
MIDVDEREGLWMETTIKINMSFSKKYRSGYPLLLKEAVVNPDKLVEEGQILNVIDEEGTFIGKGYYGLQNKGLGWIVTDKKDDLVDEGLFRRKLIKAFGRRRSFFENERTTAFRLFNGEGDGIGGLTIDYFDGFYLINWYSEGIYSFKSTIVDVLSTHTAYRGIYEKKRFATDGKYVEDDDFIMGERGEFPLIVKENGVNVAVYLNEGAMVGVFMDQRHVREALLNTYAKGRTVLNTFSYTGAFSVFATLGGAEKTTSVDLANRSREKTAEHFTLNNVDPSTQHIIVEDVFAFFKRAEKRGDRYGLVILDPPSFARSKKYTFSAAKDYSGLLQQAIRLTEEDGIIVASINHSGVSRKKFRKMIDQSFREEGISYKVVESHSLPDDYQVDRHYPEGNYLKVAIIKRLGQWNEE